MTGFYRGLDAEGGGVKPEFEPAVAVLTDICKERVRQMEEEGYTPEHDDAHDRGELTLAAISHAGRALELMTEKIDESRRLAGEALAECWPFAGFVGRVKPPRRYLVIAAALIVAEIERLDRAAAENAHRDAAFDVAHGALET